MQNRYYALKVGGNVCEMCILAFVLQGSQKVCPGGHAIFPRPLVYLPGVRGEVPVKKAA